MRRWGGIVAGGQGSGLRRPEKQGACETGTLLINCDTLAFASYPNARSDPRASGSRKNGTRVARRAAPTPAACASVTLVLRRVHVAPPLVDWWTPLPGTARTWPRPLGAVLVKTVRFISSRHGRGCNRVAAEGTHDCRCGEPSGQPKRCTEHETADEPFERHGAYHGRRPEV